METKVTAFFDGDSKRFHRFLIDPGQEVNGSLYIPKGSQIPDEIVILFRSRKNSEKKDD